MSNNTNLHTAKKQKNDEFYTLYRDIDKEVSHYKDQLSGKTIYCNCDLPESNFPTYFCEHFKEYGLKQLYATGYKEGGKGTYLHYDGRDLNVRPLTGDGSYDSEECLDILYNKDPGNMVVITNPPFSIWRQYYTTITNSGVDFLILGNTNAVTYKDVFPDIKNGKTRLGYTYGNMWFRLPDTAEKWKKEVADNDPEWR